MQFRSRTAALILILVGIAFLLSDNVVFTRCDSALSVSVAAA